MPSGVYAQKLCRHDGAGRAQGCAGRQNREFHHSRAPQGDIRARAYAPVAAGGDALPALVYFHGGGFVVGDLDTHDGLCRLLAHEGGFRVIAVDYRLAPETNGPRRWTMLAATRLDFRECGRLGHRCRAHRHWRGFRGRHLTRRLTQAAKEKGGMAIAFQLLLFPGTDLASHFASMDKYAVGYFMEKSDYRMEL